MNANRPLPIRQLTPRSASTDRSPLRYDFRTETTSIIKRSREAAQTVSIVPGPASKPPLMGTDSNRVHRHQPGGAPGRIQATERAGDDRQADAQRVEPGGERQLQAARDELVRQARPRGGQDAPNEPREQAEVRAFERHQR